MKRLITAMACMLTTAAAVTAGAGEIGHYSPAAPAIRDFVMPEPGFIVVLYNVDYSTNRINDRDGNEIRSANVGGLPVNVSAQVDFYALSPTLIWVTKWRLLGAKYGAYAAPAVDNASVSAAFTTQSGGLSYDASQLAFGDLYVQPVWLGWRVPHADVTLGYGFYAPTGRYETNQVALPGGGTATAEAPANVGHGFWTHQLQAAATTYPWAHRRTAILTALTWEIHRQKRDFDLTPGQNLSFGWGVGQRILLDETKVLEVGPAGYGTWQVSADRGRDAARNGVRDHTVAVGGQVALTYLPWKSNLTLRWLDEIATVDRFQGSTVAVNYGVVF